MGDYRDSGLFRRVEEPAAIRPGQLSNRGQIAHVDAALRSAAVRARTDAEQLDILHEITRQTRLEVSPEPASGKPQVAFGPLIRLTRSTGCWAPVSGALFLGSASNRGFVMMALSSTGSATMCEKKPY